MRRIDLQSFRNYPRTQALWAVSLETVVDNSLFSVQALAKICKDLPQFFLRNSTDPFFLHPLVLRFNGLSTRSEKADKKVLRALSRDANLATLKRCAKRLWKVCSQIEEYANENTPRYLV